MQMKTRPYKATSFFKPYTEDKRCTLKSTGKGIYLIKENGVIVYVGKSLSDLKGTLYRHFQQWNDKRSNFSKASQIYERITYHGRRKEYTVKVIFISAASEIDTLEQVLINKIKPRDNTQKFQFYSMSQQNNVEQKLTVSENWKPFNDEPPF